MAPIGIFLAMRCRFSMPKATSEARSALSWTSRSENPGGAIHRLAAFNEDALKSLGEGVYTLDGQGLVTFMNPAAEELSGWSFAELRGKKMHDMVHHHYRDGRPFPHANVPFSRFSFGMLQRLLHIRNGFVPFAFAVKFESLVI